MESERHAFPYLVCIEGDVNMDEVTLSTSDAVKMSQMIAVLFRSLLKLAARAHISC